MCVLYSQLSLSPFSCSLSQQVQGDVNSFAYLVSPGWSPFVRHSGDSYCCPHGLIFQRIKIKPINQPDLPPTQEMESSDCCENIHAPHNTEQQREEALFIGFVGLMYTQIV